MCSGVLVCSGISTNPNFSDVSGKYQDKEKPLKHQRRLGLGYRVNQHGYMLAVQTRRLTWSLNIQTQTARLRAGTARHFLCEKLKLEMFT